MTAFQGMDPVVVRGVADRIRHQAAQLGDVLSGVQRSVDEALSLWDGDDAHGFNGWWASHYRPAIAAAHSSLVDAAEALYRNVREQERASGVGALGGLSATSQSTPSGTLDLVAAIHAAEGQRPPDGWNVLTPEQLERLGLNSSSWHLGNGLDAQLITDGRGQYVLAYVGSTFASGGIDWTENFASASPISFGGAAAEGFGLPGTSTGQVTSSVNLAYYIAQQVGAENLTLTGHSLGGREAALASIATGAQAVTFNAAGASAEDLVYAQTLGGQHTSAAEYALSSLTGGLTDDLLVDQSGITNYVTKDDQLTYAQSQLGDFGLVGAALSHAIPDALGTTVTLQGGGGHGLDAIEAALQASGRG